MQLAIQNQRNLTVAHRDEVGAHQDIQMGKTYHAWIERDHAFQHLVHHGLMPVDKLLAHDEI